MYWQWPRQKALSVHVIFPSHFFFCSSRASVALKFIESSMTRLSRGRHHRFNIELYHGKFAIESLKVWRGPLKPSFYCKHHGKIIDDTYQSYITEALAVSMLVLREKCLHGDKKSLRLSPQCRSTCSMAVSIAMTNYAIHNIREYDALSVLWPAGAKKGASLAVSIAFTLAPTSTSSLLFVTFVLTINEHVSRYFTLRKMRNNRTSFPFTTTFQRSLAFWRWPAL